MLQSKANYFGRGQPVRTPVKAQEDNHKGQYFTIEQNPADRCQGNGSKFNSRGVYKGILQGEALVT